MEEEGNPYFTRYDLLRHVLWQAVENGILFRGYWNFWRRRKGLGTKVSNLAIESAEVIPGLRYQANPPEKGAHFSFENMTGLYSERHNSPEHNVKDLPVFHWNCKKIINVKPPRAIFNVKAWLRYLYYKDQSPYGIWFHPNGWMVFLSYKSKLWRLFFKYPILLMAGLSFKKPEEKTSGKCRWSIVLYDLGFEKHLHKWATLDKLADIFVYYISYGHTANNYDQPTIKLIRGEE